MGTRIGPVIASEGIQEIDVTELSIRMIFSLSECVPGYSGSGPGVVRSASPPHGCG
jgi:hypothetical protein